MAENKMMTLIGKGFDATYKLPGMGDPIVRGLCRGMGKAAFYSPLFKKCKNIDDVREMLTFMTGQANIPIEITKVEEDRLEFLVPSCPWGFCDVEQRGVCDAAMDLDRELFRLAGAELVIEDAISWGSQVCRISLNMI